MSNRTSDRDRSLLCAAAALGGASVLLGPGAASATDHQFHMARWCEATSGSIFTAAQGHISNVSEVDSATVQCPIVRNRTFGVNDWTVLVRDANPYENIRCFLRSRSLFGGTARSVTEETPGAGLTPAGGFDHIGSYTQWYVFNGGDALSLECTLPPAVGPTVDDRSWIFMYRIGEDA